jgi:hypothetical protein
VLVDGAAQELFAAELIAAWIAEVLAPAVSRHPPTGVGSGVGGPDVESTTREVRAVADE